MAITIGREQRDTLHEALSMEIGFAAERLGHEVDPRRGRPAKPRDAQGTRERLEADCHLMDDLGWARADGRAEFVVTVPQYRLAPVLQRLQDQAEGEIRDNAGEGINDDQRKIIDGDLDVVSACRGVLSGLGAS